MVSLGIVIRMLTSHVRYIKSKHLSPSCGGVDRVEDGRCVYFIKNQNPLTHPIKRMPVLWLYVLCTLCFWTIPCFPVFNSYHFEMTVVAFSPTLLKV